MADRDRGAWISTSLTMAADGKDRFSFDDHRQVNWNGDRAPFQEPPGDEPANPAEDSWLDEFSR